jgi:hypothetical protein
MSKFIKYLGGSFWVIANIGLFLMFMLYAYPAWLKDIGEEINIEFLLVFAGIPIILFSILNSIFYVFYRVIKNTSETEERKMIHSIRSIGRNGFPMINKTHKTRKIILVEKIGYILGLVLVFLGMF